MLRCVESGQELDYVADRRRDAPRPAPAEAGAAPESRARDAAEAASYFLCASRKSKICDA